MQDLSQVLQKGLEFPEDGDKWDGVGVAHLAWVAEGVTRRRTASNSSEWKVEKDCGAAAQPDLTVTTLSWVALTGFGSPPAWGSLNLLQPLLSRGM